MSTVTATIDGQQFVVDLAQVSGLDALSYRHAVGAELDLLLADWSDRPPMFAADLAVVKWLWVRQNLNPLAAIAEVAASVPLLPAAEEPAAAST